MNCRSLIRASALLVACKLVLVSSAQLLPEGTSTPNPEILARSACSACHLFPDPRLLDQQTWSTSIFPKMRLYMGMDKVDANRSKDAALGLQRGFFPSEPLIPESSWDAIVRWYHSKAPEKIESPSRNEGIPIKPGLFKVLAPPDRRNPPLTTFVQIQPEDHLVFMCDAKQQALDVMDARGKMLSSSPVGNIITTMKPVPEGFLTGCIGHFFPSEERRGQILFLRKTSQGLERIVLFSDLPRIADIETGDFNRDGQTDFAACMFGFFTGRFSWFEKRADGGYREHVLNEKAGAVKAVAHDFNKDGHLDLAVLFGQEMDGLFIYMNDGKGGFAEKQEVFRRAPVYGHSHFELADFNGDGEMDFLVSNGDNGDYEAHPKPYHGIRIFLAKQGKYEEAWFFPQHGAYHTAARDFDLDGDLDIASISYFPDYEKSPRESFIYLENKGGLKFEASTFPECIAGRWVTMDANDLDGDGDTDMVLGSLVEMPTVVPEPLKKLWNKKGPSLLYLINQTKNPTQSSPRK